MDDYGYDEYDEYDDAVMFEKFKSKPKAAKADRKTKKDAIQEKRREKAQDREEISKQELHRVF